MDNNYKCGYCVWLLQLHCADYLEHQCFVDKTKSGQALDLVSDENNVLTLHARDDREENVSTAIMEEILISEVMKRRPLWDLSTSRAERHQAKLKDLWKEIFNIFEGKFELDYLKKKWRQLRDEYIRARKKEKTYVPSGSGGDARAPKTRFKFYDVMKFLTDSLDEKPTETNITVDLLSPTPSTSSGTSYAESSAAKKRKITEVDLQKEILQVLHEPVPQFNGLDGFLLMLGEGFRQLPYRKRSRLQITMLTMLQNELDAVELQTRSKLRLYNCATILQVSSLYKKTVQSFYQCIVC